MKPRTRIILLSIISILIVVTIVLGVTYSFMKADIESSSVTEVSLKSCAKITLKDTGVSINLNNTYPMSKNKALQTTPYTFTVSSSCENYVGFNLYLATLNTNTLDASNIRYIITNNGSKDILAEGILSNATNAESEFSNEEKTQLNSGINGTYGSIYKLYNDSIPLQGEKSYDLYLYVDGNVTDASTMNKSFNAGIAVKSYDREAGLDYSNNFIKCDFVPNITYDVENYQVNFEYSFKIKFDDYFIDNIKEYNNLGSLETLTMYIKKFKTFYNRELLYSSELDNLNLKYGEKIYNESFGENNVLYTDILTLKYDANEMFEINFNASGLTNYLKNYNEISISINLHSNINLRNYNIYIEPLVYIFDKNAPIFDTAYAYDIDVSNS